MNMALLNTNGIVFAGTLRRENKHLNLFYVRLLLFGVASNDNRLIVKNYS